MRGYALTDQQWEKTEAFCQTEQEQQYQQLIIVEAMLYRYRAVIFWRDLPEGFGAFRVAHIRYARQSKKGVWQKVFEILSQESDNTYHMLDSTYC